MDKPVQCFSAVLGAVFGFLFGEMSGLLVTLISVVIIDYITGIIKAVNSKTLSSEIGFKGIYRKFVIFCIVALSHLIDTYVIGRGATIMSATMLFYISNEGISILENAVEIGVPFPKKIKEILMQISADDKEENKNE